MQETSERGWGAAVEALSATPTSRNRTKLRSFYFSSLFFPLLPITEHARLVSSRPCYLARRDCAIAVGVPACQPSLFCCATRYCHTADTSVALRITRTHLGLAFHRRSLCGESN